MGFLSRGIFWILLFFSPLGWAKVLLIQWSDVHSELENLTRQIYAMDLMAQDFKSQNPDNNEVVIYIIGDFTSMTPFTNDKGELLMKAIELLKKRGHTILFTPGNHDAFDWIEEPKDIQLFIDQMQKIKKWGVVILAENLTDRTPFGDSLISPSYPLKTLKPTTHIFGLTLGRILSHSNLNKEVASVLFQTVEQYDQSLKRILSQAKKQGIEQIFLGIHEGHKKVAKLAEGKNLIDSFGIAIPLMMAAHDHLVASYKKRNSMILDAGSHGSFNAIEISGTGEIVNVEHMAISAPKNDRNLFHYGSIQQNQVTAKEIQNSWLNSYEEEIQKNLLEDEILMIFKETETGNGTQPIPKEPIPVNITKSITETKLDMQHGQSYLGTLMAETLAEWLRSLIPKAQQKGLIAMFNSSTYRLEEPIKEGPLTKRLIRKIYPYSNGKAKFYKMRGEEIESLYFSLKKDYKSRAENNNRYSPHLNSNVREFNHRLQIQVAGHWTYLDKNQFYWLVVDPWLSKHDQGGSYKIPEWLEILGERQPEASKNFQGLLVEFFPKILNRHGHTLNPLAQPAQLPTGKPYEAQKATLPTTSCQKEFLSL